MNMSETKYLRTSIHVSKESVAAYNEIKKICDEQGYSMSQFISQVVTSIHPQVVEYADSDIAARLLKVKVVGARKSILRT